MRRLRRQQLVELDLDTEQEVIRCRVDAVTGAVATLTRADEARSPSAQLTRGSFGYLIFEHHGNLVALRGLAAAADAEREPKLEFVVLDGVQLPERRAAERVDLMTRVRLSPLDGGESETDWVESFTANVSMSGVLVKLRDALKASERFKLELYLGGAPAPIACEAQIARRTPTHVGMKFGAMSEEDRLRLAGTLFRQRRPAREELPVR